MMRAFLQAVWFGSLAGAALPMVFTMMMALEGLLGGAPFIAMLWLGFFPLLLTVPIVVAAALTVGLPLSLLLERARHHGRVTYVVAGALAGAALPLLIHGLNALANGFFVLFPADSMTEEWWIGSFFGALSGAVTANVWWKRRMKHSIA